MKREQKQFLCANPLIDHKDNLVCVVNECVRPGLNQVSFITDQWAEALTFQSSAYFPFDLTLDQHLQNPLC